MNESQVVLSLLYLHQLGNLGNMCLEPDPCLSHLPTPHNTQHLSWHVVVNRLRNLVIPHGIWQETLGCQNGPSGCYHSGIWVWFPPCILPAKPLTDERVHLSSKCWTLVWTGWFLTFEYRWLISNFVATFQLTREEQAPLEAITNLGGQKVSYSSCPQACI